MPPRPASSSMRQPANVDSRASSITGRSVTDSGVHEALVGRPQGRLGPRAEAELAEDVRDVRACGSLADVELGGDLLVGSTGAQQREDLELARCEACPELLARAHSERRHQAPCDGGVESQLTAVGGPDALRDLVGVRVLEKIPGGACRDRAVHALLLRERRERDYLDAGVARADRPG